MNPLRRPFTLLGLLAGGLLLILSLAAAVQPAPVVGVIDIDRIRAQSATIQQRLSEIAGPAEQLQAELKAKQDAFIAEYEQYQSQALAMSDDARDSAEARLQRQREELDTLKNEFADALRRTENEDLQAVRKQVVDTVETIARERGLTLVIPSQQSIYHAPAADLTDAVIARLDQ